MSNTRHIKFRGKSNSLQNKNEWFYGTIVYDSQWNPFIYFFDGFSFVIKRVYPESVGQLIKTDKDGQELFEGDVVKVKGTKKGGEYITEIIYENQGFKLKVNKTYFNDDASLVGVKVIGNKFDNPELLEQQ